MPLLDESMPACCPSACTRGSGRRILSSWLLLLSFGLSIDSDISIASDNGCDNGCRPRGPSCALLSDNSRQMFPSGSLKSDDAFCLLEQRSGIRPGGALP